MLDFLNVNLPIIVAFVVTAMHLSKRQQEEFASKIALSIATDTIAPLFDVIPICGSSTSPSYDATQLRTKEDDGDEG